MKLYEMPYNEEIERGILSILIYGEGKYDRVLDFIESRDFYKTQHQSMYKVIQRMNFKYDMVDAVTFNDETQSSYAVDVANLGTHYVSDAKLTQYAEKLKDISRQRQIKQAYLSGDLNRVHELAKLNDRIVNDILFDPRDIYEKVIEYRVKGEDPWVSTGWSDLDKLYKIGLGQLTVLTGIPNSGKSNWMDAMMVNVAQEENWKFICYSPESLPIQRHARSIIEKYTKQGFFAIDSEDVVKEAMDWISERFIFINPDASRRSLENIIHTVEDMDGRGLLIDPWNELEHSRPDALTETEYIAASLMRLKSLAVRKNMHVWIVAHPTKLQRNADGSYPVPTPYHISGSANWRNKPDNCLSIYRDFETNEVRVHVQKIRFKDFGKLGNVKLVYMDKTGRYELPEVF